MMTASIVHALHALDQYELEERECLGKIFTASWDIVELDIIKREVKEILIEFGKSPDVI